MIDPPDRSALIALLFAVAMLGAAVGGGAAAPTVDTSGTDATSSQSGVTDGQTVESFNGTDDNRSWTMQINGTAGEEYELVVYDDANDTQYALNASEANVTAGGAGSAHFNATIEETALRDVERTINENVSTWWTFRNASNSSKAAEVQVYLNNTDEETVENIDSDDTNDSGIAEVSEPEPFSVLGMNISIPFVSGADKTAVTLTGDDDRAVNGSETDVIIAASDADAADDFDVVDDVDSEATVSDIASFGPRMAAVVSSGDSTVPVPIYKESVPDSVDNDTTYGVVQDVGGQSAVVFNLGSEFEDADSVEVEMTANAGAFAYFSEYRSAIGFDDVTDTLNPFGFLGGFGDLVAASLIVGAPAARRREEVAD